MSPPTTVPLLEMRGIVKRFPGVLALGGVDLDVRPGEVHCLLGQNGAGKSTLIKVLSASYQPDEGEILWEGRPVALPTPQSAMMIGISTIYQELDLVPGLSVAENIFLGHELSSAGMSQRGRTNRAAADLLARLGHSELSPTREVGRLAPAAQQIVSMARALSQDTRLLILDEPSAALDQGEVDNLFRVIRDLTAEGVAVVYISHRLEEIRQIGDRITVLKDGRTVASGLAVADTPTADLIKLMTGRSIEYVFPPRSDTATTTSGAPILEVTGLELPGVFSGVDLRVHAGEIVGLANDEESSSDAAPVAAEGGNDESGDTVTIGFSAPAADHGWMAAITNNVRDLAEQYPDIDLQVAEGTNEVSLQISQVETFINDGVDAIVLLPFDGAALTPIALEAMEAGITVINVDREFDDPNAARVTVLGDNYGMGVSAGEYVCEQADGNEDAIVAEIAGIDSLPLTQDRSQGFEDALSECGLDVDARQAAEFTVESGEEVAASLLQAEPKIDYLWNHDDDQGVGVLAAIENAGRDEFVMVGGAGSANAMREIQDDSGVLKATVIYPSTQGADGVKLARLILQQKAMTDLVEVEVPRLVQLYAPVVTGDNVDQYIDSAFES